MKKVAEASTMKAHVRRRRYTHKGRPAHTWAVFVTNNKGETLYSDNGFKTQQLAMQAGLFDIAARDHVWRVCAGIGGWR